MFAPKPPQLLPPMSPLVRLAIVGAIVAAMVYLAFGLERIEPPPPPPEAPEPEVVVPSIDRDLLARVADATREQRLQLEAEPLRHLLHAAIDVGPTVAAALGAPDRPVPLAELRAEPGKWRGRWLWYEGELLDLTGPRDGHPIRGYGIFEATIRMPGGEHAIAAFSIPPEQAIQRGAWVRIDGFLLKLRDTTYPIDVREAPLLVGRAIQRDYEDWGPVRELDAKLLAGIDDADFSAGSKMWNTIDEDQTEALWHLAAYARDTADDRSLAEWRRVPILAEATFFDDFRDHTVERGLERRIVGSLIQRKTIAAPANPAGIRFWTVGLVQVREYGGATIPIWVPKRVGELPMRAQLEVRGHYYRRFAFEAINGQRHYVPVFVAADLTPLVVDPSPVMRQLGLGIGGVLLAMFVGAWWANRRMARESLQHQREMDARRRRRREQAGHPTAPSSSAT